MADHNSKFCMTSLTRLTIPFLWEDPFSIPTQHYHARLEGISRHIAIILLSSTLINRNRKEIAWLEAIKAIGL
ncbi:hypothetical protein GLOIN_2v1476691 [Rhizophagus irregularis DAOM 181602=DAOM 197198]|nr:hypothetical protein RhiirB3_138745 [Rhizophagus irregularis]GET62234.1 hypothetical protein GLOIN_2v1476691 [Rhizophagus irregularis DAOM 181602=DAOM 197198]